MITKIWKELLILMAVFAAIWMGLSYYHYEVDENPFSISLDREKELSEFMEKYLMSDFKMVRNSQLDSSLQIIMTRLTDHMDTATYNYKLHVIQSDQINAFTSLHGNIYVFTGLIQKLESAEELAVVLAHEIGHAENKHVVEKLITTLGMETLFSIISGGDPVLLSKLAKMTASTSFDRKNEEEADDFALNLATKSQINPRRLGQFFLTLKSENKNPILDIEFIRTHPLDNDRIKKSSDFKLPDDFQEVLLGLDWNVVKSYTLITE